MFARSTTKIYLDWLQLSVCPQIYDIKKNAKLCCNKTNAPPHFSCEVYDVVCCWKAPSSGYPFDKVQISLNSSHWSADVHFMPHCHSPLLKCGHSSKDIVIAEALSVTQGFITIFFYWMLQWGPHPLMWFLMLFFLGPTKQVYPLFHVAIEVWFLVSMLLQF